MSHTWLSRQCMPRWRLLGRDDCELGAERFVGSIEANHLGLNHGVDVLGTCGLHQNTSPVPLVNASYPSAIPVETRRAHAGDRSHPQRHHSPGTLKPGHPSI
jgi:hypothetical protein